MNYMHEFFIRACEKGDMRSIKEEITPHLVNCKNKKLETVLILASFGGHAETVKFLIENGAGVDIPDFYGRTALMHASRSGHLDIVKVLLKNGADIDAIDNAKQNAFMWALGGRQTLVQDFLAEVMTRKLINRFIVF